jgi:hypothetical protein
MTRRYLLLVLTAGIAACSEEPPAEQTKASMEDSVFTPAADDPILQAPPGGWLDWVTDIRTGLGSVKERAAADRGAALEIVQQLLQTRNEYLVQYFGAGGSAHAGDALEQAISRVTMHLQELTRQLATDASTLPQIEEATTAALGALDEVETAARAAGLPPTAPRDQ